MQCIMIYNSCRRHRATVHRTDTAQYIGTVGSATVAADVDWDSGVFYLHAVVCCE